MGAVPMKADISEIMARYLRRCRSGGLTKKQSDLISGAVEDAQRLGYFDVPPAGAAWEKTAERRPDAGRMIVKRWKTGSVWAGVYSGSEKDSSFDEWCYLP